MGSRPTLWVVVAVLAAHNVAGNLWFPSWAYVPANLTAGVIVVGLAMRSGVPGSDIAGPRSLLQPGLRAGLVIGALAGSGIVVGALCSCTSELFADARVLGVGTAGMLYNTLLRIPIGTALFEETAFRGVLPALGRRVTTPRRARVMAALLFGLWHVIPATSVAGGNQGVAGYADGVVVLGAAIATAAVGWALSAMRDHWGLAAPIVLHAAVNSVAFAVAWAMV